MRLGACTNPGNLPILKQMGLDYWDVHLAKLVAMEDAEFEQVKADCEKYGLYAEASFCFLPGEIKLFEKPDMEELKTYCEKGFTRLAALGGKTSVFGSGGSRQIPEGYDREIAEKEFIEVLRIIGDIGAKYGISIAIEPLRAEETNFINTVAECWEICKKIDRENVKCLADFYHVSCANEPMSNIEAVGEDLIHMHLSAPDRSIPTVADEEICKVWKATLDKMGYAGRMSLEGKWLPDFETAAKNVMPILEIFR